MSFVPKAKLPRLQRERYRGHAAVFWTHTIERRATGWLSDRFHTHFRELLLHTCSRYELVCPIYVLMPDHWHLIWMGVTEACDQSVASSFFRKHIANALRPALLQNQAHDHVLRSKEIERNAFIASCDYIRQNPVRAGLVKSWQEWCFSGLMVPGYPQLDAHESSFWETFWKIHNRLVERSSEVPALTGKATGDVASGVSRGIV